MRAFVTVAVLTIFMMGTVYSPSPAVSAFQNNAPSGPDAPVRFVNVSEAVGLANIRSGNNWEWGDYNNDGYEDLLIQGTYLFGNNGPPAWDFTNVTAQAGIWNKTSLMAGWADYDNDDWIDFYACDLSEPSYDHLWHNNGNGTFTDVTEQAGHVTDIYPSSSPNWGDYDLDGYLDLYVCNWATNQTIYYPDKLWHNNGDGTFTDVTVAAGADESANPAGNLGACWGDYNNDGWPDLYVGCYFLHANYLYENRNGHLTDVAVQKGVEGHETDRLGNPYYGHSPGAMMADIDNDLNMDIWVSNNAHRDYYRAGICDSTYFFHNNGPTMNYNFTDVFTSCGVPYYPAGGNEELYFGQNFFDWDNDGDVDMYLPLVHDDIDYAHSYMMRNNGNNTFTDISLDTGLRVWNTVASAFCDYDQDGDIDMITEGKVPYQNGTYAHRLFQNQGNGNDFVGFKLKGTRINSEAIHARVTLTLNDGRKIMREVQSQTGTHSQGNSRTLHFGLGDYTGTVDAVIRWSPWNTQNITGLEINKVHALTEPGKGADLQVSKVEFPATAQSGQNVRFNIEVGNVGDYAVSSYIVRLRTGPVTGNIVDEAHFTSTLVPGSAQSLSLGWSPRAEGDQILYVTVDNVVPRDPVASNNQYKCTVKVTKPAPPNLAPVISSFSASKTDVLPNETVSLTVQASDPEGDSLSYSYTGTGGNYEPSGDRARWTAPASPGSYQLTVSVSDGRNHTTRATLSITVKSPPPPIVNPPENHLPRIASFRYSPDNVLNDGNTLLVLTVEASDQDGTDDIARAVFRLAEVGGPSSTEVRDAEDGVFEYRLTVPKGIDPGAKTVTVDIFDKSGASARKTLIVGINSPPVPPKKNSSNTFIPGPDVLMLALAVTVIIPIARRRRLRDE